VILAAGVGRRLAPLTDDRPKALVAPGGRPLLGRALDALERAGFLDVLVVSGHREEALADFLAARDGPAHLTTLHNEAFDTANNVVSFLVARDRLAGGFCLLNSDIVFEATVLDDVVAAPPGSWLVVDGDEPLGDEEMKVRLDADGRIRRITKRMPATDAAGEYIGIARFDEVGAAAALDAAARLVGDGATDRYYEDAFDAVLDVVVVRPIWMRGRLWSEIDDHADLRRAEGIARHLDAATVR
jgi:choline kinase